MGSLKSALSLAASAAAFTILSAACAVAPATSEDTGTSNQALSNPPGDNGTLASFGEACTQTARFPGASVILCAPTLVCGPFLPTRVNGRVVDPLPGEGTCVCPIGSVWDATDKQCAPLQRCRPIVCPLGADGTSAAVNPITCQCPPWPPIPPVPPVE
jgi:hypothetical protein